MHVHAVVPAWFIALAVIGLAIGHVSTMCIYYIHVFVANNLISQAAVSLSKTPNEKPLASSRKNELQLYNINVYYNIIIASIKFCIMELHHFSFSGGVWSSEQPRSERWW